MKHRFVLESEAVRILSSLSTRDRTGVVDALKVLVEDMPLQDEAPVRSHNGRPLYRKRIRKWMVWYWVDGPVWEVRVIDFKKVR